MIVSDMRHALIIRGNDYRDTSVPPNKKLPIQHGASWI